MKHAFEFAGETHSIDLSRSSKGYCLLHGDEAIPVNLETAADGSSWLTVGGRREKVVTATHGDTVFIHYDGETHALRYWHPLDRLAAATAGDAEDTVLAPMPGNVISVVVSPGDKVTKGQTLMSIESMKMETTITSPRDAVIAEISYETGQTFERDAQLLSLLPADTEADS